MCTWRAADDARYRTAQCNAIGAWSRLEDCSHRTRGFCSAACWGLVVDLIEYVVALVLLASGCTAPTRGW
jgi:hypothetical protein